MKQFIIETCIVVFSFLLIVYLYYCVSTTILCSRIGPTTAFQIETQFENLISQKDTIKTLYLGSSRFYRAIDPLIIGKNGYNFAHDNDAYNQVFYKLIYAYEKLPNLKNVIIAYDYVSFSFISGTRNYVYHKFLSKEYLNDYENTFYDNYILPFLNISNTPSATIRAMFRSEKLYDLTPKGQLTYFSGNATDKDVIKRDETVLKIQEEYFYRIIEFCKEKNLQCVFVNMPIRDGEYNSYTKDYLLQMDRKINSVISDNINYIDYSRVESLLSTNLFTDICHYNVIGSHTLSSRLKEDINKIIK